MNNVRVTNAHALPKNSVVHRRRCAAATIIFSSFSFASGTFGIDWRTDDSQANANNFAPDQRFVYILATVLRFSKDDDGWLVGWLVGRPAATRSFWHPFFLLPASLPASRTYDELSLERYPLLSNRRLNKGKT